MSLRGRLTKLERVHGVGRCPHCRGRDERLTDVSGNVVKAILK